MIDDAPDDAQSIPARREPRTTDQVDMAAEFGSLQSEYRLWLRALTDLVKLRSRESDPSGRVQLALDLAMVAACERIGRICRSDQPSVGRESRK